MNDLNLLFKHNPNVSITIQGTDLNEFGRFLIAETQREAERRLKAAKEETHCTVTETAKRLGVDKSTLWRWSRNNYLSPIEIGGKRRYKESDISRILEGVR